MPRLHIIGRKNSGKTTLIVELVEQLTIRGLRVGTVKHTHHHHELDTPGKDTYRHRQAGAAAVGILAPAMNAIFWPAPPDHDRYQQFDALLEDCELVLVEGHSQADGLKIEVWREQPDRPPEENRPFASTDTSISAVVSDDQVPAEVDVWPRNDIDAIIQQIRMLMSN